MSKSRWHEEKNKTAFMKAQFMREKGGINHDRKSNKTLITDRGQRPIGEKQLDGFLYLVLSDHTAAGEGKPGGKSTAY